MPDTSALPIRANVIPFPRRSSYQVRAFTAAYEQVKPVREALFEALALASHERPSDEARQRAVAATSALLFLILPGEDVELRRLLNARLIARKNDHANL